MAAELYGGDVLQSSESMTMKPVKLWDMTKPRPIADLTLQGQERIYPQHYRKCKMGISHAQLIPHEGSTGACHHSQG